MKMSLRLCAVLAAIFAAFPVILQADAFPASYILVHHVGYEDQPMPSLVITADREIAADFNTRKRLAQGGRKGASVEELFTRVSLLEEEEFRKVASLCAQGMTKLAQPERALEPLMEHGTFEVSARTNNHQVTAFYFIAHRKDSIELLGRLSRFVSDQEISTNLREDINELIETIEREDATFPRL